MDGYLIEVEGIDKAGKNLVTEYIIRLSEYRHTVHSRGLLSNMVYSKKFGRGYSYYNYKPIIIYLDVDEIDRLVRCKLTNEPVIDSSLDRSLFEQYIKQLESEGNIVFRYNSSYMTPYQIALDVLDKLDKLGGNL